MRGRKASLRVTLVLIGAASLVSCGKSLETAVRRDEYASLQDCLADWEKDEKHCSAEVADSRQTGQSSRSGSNFPYYTRYYGPSYYSHADGRRDYSASGITSSRPSSAGITSGAANRSIGSSSASSVSRGGFGSSAHSSAGS